MKKSLCSLIVFSTLFASFAITPKTNQVYATENSNDVFMNIGEKYYYDDANGEFNITDSVDGNSISQEEVYDLNISLYNHTSNAANSLNSFSSTANTNISLDDALFTFTKGSADDKYTILNQTTNKYLTNTEAKTFFNDSSLEMKVTNSTEVEGSFNICVGEGTNNGKRFIIFYNSNMDFNTNTNFTSNYTGGSYHLLLLNPKDNIGTDDVIPGYEQVTEVESGKSYLIAYKNNLGVFVLYPTNGTANQTKLVKFNNYNNLYDVGSSTVSTDTIAQNHLTLTQTDSGISMKATNGKYMRNVSRDALLGTDEVFFNFEAGSKAGTYRIKTVAGRYYVFVNSGTKMDGMGSYIESWDGSSGSYDFMFFKKTDTVDITSLIPGYEQVTDMTNISSEDQYIIVYVKEQTSGDEVYVCRVLGSLNNSNTLRKAVNGTKKVKFIALEYGKETVVINGNTLNFYVVSNLAANKVPTAHWSSDDSTCNIASGHNASKATDGTINTDNYIDFGEDNNTNGSYIQIDLGQTSLIKKINLYRYWHDSRTYRNTVIAVSNDPQFHNYKVIHNTDTNNIHGLGAGTGSTYSESSSGKSFVFNDTTARYVRVYMNGQSDSKTTNHIVELQVFGYPVTPETITTDSIISNKNDTYVGNYLFEGYYTDDTCEIVQTKEQYLSNESYVAKYVNPDVLTVKGQAKNNGDGTYTIRFVSSVASLNLDEVGFEIRKNAGNIKNISTRTVYTQIKETITNNVLFTNPSEVFNNDESEYFFSVKITGTTDLHRNDEITITPYWVPHGSNKKVKGTTRTETLSTFIDSAPIVVSE